MKNIVIKKSGNSWMVRQTYNKNGATWWKTSMCNTIPQAIITYIKYALSTKKKSR